jgi:hypothetical protein
MTIYSSNYHQVPVGNYIATTSMASRPHSNIEVNNGAETHIALRLGRLFLDPRNYDGTAGKQEIAVFAIKEGKAVWTTYTKGGDSLELAPGQYIIHTSYGLKKVDTVTISSRQCTRLTISGAAKFTATQEGIDIRRIIPKSVPLWIALLRNGQEIQVPPGLYEIKVRGAKTGYRLNMQSGQAYTYQMP